MGEQRRYKGVEGICRRVRGYMGVQRRHKGVEGICRGVRGYMGVQRRYKGVEGICRRHGDNLCGSLKTIQWSTEGILRTVRG